MSTKSLQIRNAIIGLHTASPVAGVASTSIYTDWHWAIKPADMPAIVVEMSDEAEPQSACIGDLNSLLQIKVSVISDGSDAAATADPIIAESYNRIMSNYSLGGLALTINKGPTTRTRDVLDKPVMITEIIYLVEYRTARTSLEF